MTEKNAPRPIVEQSSEPSSNPHCDKIVGESITKRSGACEDVMGNDERQWLATVLEGLETRSHGVREALKKALSDGERGAGPLLGLELTTTENKQENDEPIEDSNQSALLAPLLGTITSQQTESLGKSSHERSSKRVCYAKLLRDDGSSLAGKSQKTVSNAACDCYRGRRTVSRTIGRIGGR